MFRPRQGFHGRNRRRGGRQGDSPAAFTLTGLQARAADFYSQLRTPSESWRTLQDVRPQLAEFHLRCDAGDHDTAATVLHDIEGEYLRVWGYTRILIDLHRRIHQRITDRVLASHHLCDMGLCHYRLGEYRQAADLLTQAVAMARDTGDRQLERAALGNLGNCHNCLGYYQKAIDLQTSALAICGREDIFGLGTWAHRWRTSSSTEAQDDHKFAATSMIDRRPGRMLAELARSPLTCTGGRRL